MPGVAGVAQVGVGNGQAGAGGSSGSSGSSSRAGRIHAPISTAAGRRHGSGFIAPCTGVTGRAVARATLCVVARDFVRS
jgi:hypothetical protein